EQENAEPSGDASTVALDQPTTKLRVPYPPLPPEDEPRPAPNQPPGGFSIGWPRGRRPRQANLQLKRLDPWSVLKIALGLAVLLYLVCLVPILVLYAAL